MKGTEYPDVGTFASVATGRLTAWDKVAEEGRGARREAEGADHPQAA